MYHQYTIRIDGATGAERDGVVAALREEHKVGCGVYYPIPNHELVSLARFAPGHELPETARAAAEFISLPVHPSLTQEDLERIASASNSLTFGRGRQIRSAVLSAAAGETLSSTRPASTARPPIPSAST